MRTDKLVSGQNTILIPVAHLNSTVLAGGLKLNDRCGPFLPRLFCEEQRGFELSHFYFGLPATSSFEGYGAFQIQYLIVVFIILRLFQL